MDAEGMQASFTEFVRSLFAMGYLDDGFRELYVTNGVPTDLKLVIQSITLHYVNIESVMGSIKFKLNYSLDFPLLNSNTTDIHLNAERMGAARIMRLNEQLRACSDLRDKDGCFWYLEMLDFELQALMSALSDVLLLHEAIQKARRVVARLVKTGT